MAHNQFSTWTDDEYSRLLGDKGFEGQVGKVVELTADHPLPEGIDWRNHGAVNAVKNQGKCGSCWTFAATAITEGHTYLRHGHLPVLSEQQFVDCVDTCEGCNGGLARLALEHAQTHA